METKNGERATERSPSLADRACAAVDRATIAMTAGEATRQNAKRALEARASEMRRRANQLVAEARDGMKHMDDKTVIASDLMNSATAIEALADECEHLRGPAEYALWSLAVERANNGV